MRKDTLGEGVTLSVLVPTSIGVLYVIESSVLFQNLHFVSEPCEMSGPRDISHHTDAPLSTLYHPFRANRRSTRRSLTISHVLSL